MNQLFGLQHRRTVPMIFNRSGGDGAPDGGLWWSTKTKHPSRR